jgi:hypothetical protein
MAKLAIKKASTDVTTYVFIQDSSKTTGEGLTGLAYNTGSLVGYYVRPKGSATAITLATQTVTGDHSDGGFVEIDATNMPGVYRLDLPDAVCATGVNSVVVMLKGATNMSPVVLELQLTDFDLNDASPNVTVADIATDAITAAAVKADAVTKIQNGLALEATLTAIKGAGWSTETLAAIDVLIDAIKAKTDALDVSSVTVVTAVNGTTITIWRGDTFSGALTNIGALTDYVSIDFTVKEAYSKTDDEATIRIRKNASGTSDGLMRLNGAAATSSALGSIAIDDLASGDITITLDETATDDLSTGTYVYDAQMISASGVKTLTYGKLIVTADVTRLVA